MASQATATTDFNTDLGDGKVIEVEKGDKFPASSEIVKQNAHCFEKPSKASSGAKKAQK